MNPTVIEDNDIDFEPYEEDGSALIAAETSWRGFTTELQELQLAADIKTYFETNQDALEVLIFKGKKLLPVNRIQIQSPDFNRVFRKRYEK